MQFIEEYARTVGPSPKQKKDSIGNRMNKNIKECKGLLFRGFRSTFFDGLTNKIERREGIRLLKKRSCPGCEQCGHFLDQMDDMIATDTLLFPEEGIEHNKLYTIIVTNIETDWESGMVDAWDFEIIKQIEGEACNGR